jgi:GST-like protein
MIDLYAWPTPNGYKISIMLEETGLPYRVIAVNIGKGEQFAPDFLKISPNNRMPAIVDHESADGRPLSIFESGAILVYLAEKSGRFGGATPRERMGVLQWLMWQMGGLGPMMGQAGHFINYAPEKIAYGIERYTNETKRLLGVADKRLAAHEFLAGDFYSIADMAAFPWARNYARFGIDASAFPNVTRWAEQLAARPGVQRGLDLLKEHVRQGPPSAEAREILYGKTQYETAEAMRKG